MFVSISETLYYFSATRILKNYVENAHALEGFFCVKFDFFLKLKLFNVLKITNSQKKTDWKNSKNNGNSVLDIFFNYAYITSYQFKINLCQIEVGQYIQNLALFTS